MAGALVGGAFLSGFINVVFDRLLTADAINSVLGKKLGADLVERLKISLLAAEVVLDDAEYKQLGDEHVREWLNSLRDAVYDADDFLDAVLTKQATQKEVHSFLPSFFLNRHRKMVDNMEGVVARIEFLVKQKDILGLQKITKDNNLSSSSSSWRQTTSLMEGKIYGREHDQQALIKKINDNSGSHLSVIPIVGMGGVGKTTLAKWAYSVAEGFDLKAWVCISETFDVADITKKTIEEITKNSCTIGSLNLLQNKLQEILSAKKFFIVLDDIWSDDTDKWKQFITPFQYGAKGSTILLTTRNQEAASVVQTCPSCILNELSEEYCWLLFAANACFPESNGNPALEKIGRKIVKKCKGLPLAVETLGRLLRGEDDVKEWNAVLMSDIWEFSMKNCKIIPALLISYFQLPPYLKRCFVYCSLYPKDHDFEKNQLILLWMAEDLLRLPKRGESLEEVGCECFEELTSRLFFKPAEHFSERYVMHDLLHDLAIFLAGNFYCRIEELGEQEEKKVLTRHLSHLPHGSLDHPISKVLSIVKSESLRTSLYIDDLLTMKGRASKLKYLRVLSFRELAVLPDSIGKLIHLRYLNLSKTNIDSLPESLCNLYNLQTLILYKCFKLTILPNGMHKLVNLQHLDLRGTCLEEMPRGISKLKHMCILDYFVVGKHKDNGIQELGGLSNLHGSFEIKKLENVVDVGEARSARIIDKKHIDSLLFNWSSDDDMVSNIQTERDILDSLQPHNGLKELRVKGYRGTIFPDWLGNCSYNNMTSVSLVACKNCRMLPSLGQLPSLKSLRIERFDQLKSIGMEFYKNEGNQHSSPIALFPLLETLVFWDMPSWEVWHLPDSETFSQLGNLQIRYCPVLKGDLLGQVFLRIISSSSYVQKVRKLRIWEDWNQEMRFVEDTLTIKGSESLVECALKVMISINYLSCLQELHISGCSSAVSFPGNCLPKSLQKLRISYCRQLVFPEQQQQKYDLVELQIGSSCDFLTSLLLDAFPNLKNLEIRECKNLESVSMSESPHAALQHLTIDYCEKLVSFTGEGLAAPNLTHLSLIECDKLEALPHDMNSLLPSLQSLEIRACRNLESVSMSEAPQAALQHLTIQYCDKLVSFAAEGLAAPNLTRLSLIKCDKLEALPHDMNSLLPSLQSLKIHGCPNICRLPEGGLPPNLKSLDVGFCEQQTRDLSWMANLDALTYLRINGDRCQSVKSFPEVGLLPHLPSLTTLKIRFLHNLETLECNELLRLTSLQQLHISYCEKLENIEGEKLPPSLLLLKMEYCGLLGKHCRNKHQLIWPKISHIPTIQVHGN